MKISCEILVAAFLLMTFSVNGQTRFNTEAIADKQIDEYNSEQQINKLKNGALLVRLNTSAPLLKALKKRGKTELYQKMQKRQWDENHEIIEAFNDYFHFCNVYFFYSYDSDYIRESKTDSVTFLNDSLQADTTIQLKEHYFLVADFARLKPDTSTIETELYLYRGENGLEQRRRQEVSGNFGFEALLFFSPQLYQLRKPFPYYIRTLESLPVFRRSYAKAVRMANSELDRYYSRVN